ncbi:hypothetical protein D3C73_1049860 [compost metagenome]
MGAFDEGVLRGLEGFRLARGDGAPGVGEGARARRRPAKLIGPACAVGGQELLRPIAVHRQLIGTIGHPARITRAGRHRAGTTPARLIARRQGAQIWIDAFLTSRRRRRRFSGGFGNRRRRLGRRAVQADLLTDLDQRRIGDAVVRRQLAPAHPVLLGDARQRVAAAHRMNGRRLGLRGAPAFPRADRQRHGLAGIDQVRIGDLAVRRQQVAHADAIAFGDAGQSLARPNRVGGRGVARPGGGGGQTGGGGSGERHGSAPKDAVIRQATLASLRASEIWGFP